MAKQPTQRTLELGRKIDWLIGVVERWNPKIKKRHDLFGFADLVAIDPDRQGSIYIQTTTEQNVPARIEKILGETEEAARRVLEAGNHIEVWGWYYGPTKWKAVRYGIDLMGSNTLISFLTDDTDFLEKELQNRGTRNLVDLARAVGI